VCLTLAVIAVTATPGQKSPHRFRRGGGQGRGLLSRSDTGRRFGRLRAKDGGICRTGYVQAKQKNKFTSAVLRYNCERVCVCVCVCVCLCVYFVCVQCVFSCRVGWPVGLP
jgi:hypothetical protein